MKIRHALGPFFLTLITVWGIAASIHYCGEWIATASVLSGILIIVLAAGWLSINIQNHINKDK